MTQTLRHRAAIKGWQTRRQNQRYICPVCGDDLQYGEIAQHVCEPWLRGIRTGLRVILRGLWIGVVSMVALLVAINVWRVM